MSRYTDRPYNEFGKLLTETLKTIKGKNVHIAKATGILETSISCACFEPNQITHENVVAIVSYLKSQGAKANLDEFLGAYGLIATDIKIGILRDPKINARKVRRILKIKGEK
jgi:hypothetical protein